MNYIIIKRGESTNAGTFGTLLLNHGQWSCVTLELPWRDNASGLSCIPPGIYTCKMIDSPKHGHCYQVMDVPKRNMIEIHAVNFAGDKTKINPVTDTYYISQLLGCIGLGRSMGILDGQMAILRSKETVADFERYLGGENFMLDIT